MKWQGVMGRVTCVSAVFLPQLYIFFDSKQISQFLLSTRIYVASPIETAIAPSPEKCNFIGRGGCRSFCTSQQQPTATGA